MSPPRNPPILLHEAQARLLAQVAPLPAETFPAEAALGRCLAEPLLALRTQPAADLSAMDGYAVKAGERGPWTIVGESAAGHPFPGTLSAGEAIRISTGALMPDGGEAVLLQENAIREGNALVLNGEGDPDPQTCEGAGTDGGGDPVEPVEREPRLGHHPARHRRQAFLVAAGHHLAGGRQHALAVEDGDRAGGKAGVEAEDDHRPSASRAIVRRPSLPGRSA